MIRLVLVGILLLLSLSFFLHNQEQEVTLRYFFGLRSASTPIYKPILSAFALGLLRRFSYFPPGYGDGSSFDARRRPCRKLRPT